MNTPDLIARLSALGLRLSREGDGIRVAPRSALTDETRNLIRAHKSELLAALARSGQFAFAPPGDPENDAEAVAERSAIVAVENGWDDATALQEARWQADREKGLARVPAQRRAHPERARGRTRGSARPLSRRSRATLR